MSEEAGAAAVAKHFLSGAADVRSNQSLCVYCKQGIIHDTSSPLLLFLLMVFTRL